MAAVERLPTGAFPKRDAPQARPAVPSALTDTQRETVLAFYATNPDGGYLAACKAAGLKQLTRQEAKALITSDDELVEAKFRALHLDEPGLFKQLGTIANNAEHKDQFRAVTWGLNAIHRWHENGQQIEVNVATAVAVEDRSASLADVARILESVGAIAVDRGGVVGGEVADARALLPADQDG